MFKTKAINTKMTSFSNSFIIICSLEIVSQRLFLSTGSVWGKCSTMVCYSTSLSNAVSSDVTFVLGICSGGSTWTRQIGQQHISWLSFLPSFFLGDSWFVYLLPAQP